MTEQRLRAATLLGAGSTVATYRKWEQTQDRNAIANFLIKRIRERYILPVVDSPAKHGFALMVVSCLLIETFDAFYEGNPTTAGQGHQCFQRMFDREDGFSRLRPYARPFYADVRSALLHQAETSRGWRIRRTGALFEPTTKTLNATRFIRTVEKALLFYCDELRSAPWDSKLWGACRKKMDRICRNAAHV